jgi:hypothetical protein
VTNLELRRASGLRGASSKTTFLHAGGVTSNKPLERAGFAGRSAR